MEERELLAILRRRDGRQTLSPLREGKIRSTARRIHTYA